LQVNGSATAIFGYGSSYGVVGQAASSGGGGVEGITNDNSKYGILGWNNQYSLLAVGPSYLNGNVGINTVPTNYGLTISAPGGNYGIYVTGGASTAIVGVSGGGGGVFGQDQNGTYGMLGANGAAFYGVLNGPGTTTYLGYSIGGNNFSFYGNGNLQANGVTSFAISGGTAAYFNGSGTFGYNSSTRASKINIQNLSDVSWLIDLEPVSFNFRKQDADKNYTDEFYPETLIGLIADDAALVNSYIGIFSEDNRILGLHYDRLVVPMLKMLQNLRKEFDEYKKTHP
jgi:hypothetical protein